MKRKARIAVLVSGGGTNLQALIDAEKRGELPDGEIVLVVGSREGIYALTRAEQAGIQYTVVHKDEEKLISVLEENDIDLIILAGFLTILSERFTKRFADRIINIHPSLIPSFPCTSSVFQLHGIILTGYCFHHSYGVVKHCALSCFLKAKGYPTI